MSLTFSLMFYNTENFYDTVDDPLTMDDDFTPKGSRKWTDERYNEKVRKITDVINEIVRPEFPDIIALAEIENKTVMNSILDEMRSRGKKGYSYVHYDSPDERGSDVAIIYNMHSFKILKTEPILVHLPGIEDRTRDILYVKGKLPNDETLHLFVTHFPSRGEGKNLSEPRRYFVAGELKNAIHKVTDKDSNAKVIIMGDFNDTPDNNSVDEVLGAQKNFENIQNKKLYNLLYPRHKRGLGSTFHKEWMLFDQIIVSGSLLTANNIDCKPEYADIFNPEWLLYFGKSGVPKPNRTYSGKYVGGYSDHLPVFLKFFIV